MGSKQQEGEERLQRFLAVRRLTCIPSKFSWYPPPASGNALESGTPTGTAGLVTPCTVVKVYLLRLIIISIGIEQRK
jgi:hypothetical protein